jgi:hypothetical protein
MIPTTTSGQLDQMVNRPSLEREALKGPRGKNLPSRTNFAQDLDRRLNQEK